FDLARGSIAVARLPADITFYKSTGSAIFDLAAAALVAKASGVSA
ncbi:MAG: ornithine cyclodeaminase family protein, partial [Methylobacterium sp.]|nr:ornithine cyclodeaminase family protein [Methylobacterium sp.]